MHGAEMRLCPQSRCWLEIDLNALRWNWARVRACCAEGCEPMAVVKCNGYGLGAVPIARELEQAGCSSFAVADLDEALELRRAGIRAPIFLLGPIGPSDAAIASEENIIVPVVDAAHGRVLSAAAFARGLCLRTHIKVDVGLTRLGIPVPGREEEAAAEVRSILSLPGLTNEGIFTHISGMMEPEMDYLNIRQAELFREFVGRLGEAGKRLKKHCASSLLFLLHPEYHMDYVRLTSVLLGIQKGGETLALQNVAAMKARLLQVKHVPRGTSIGYWMSYVAPRDMEIGIAGVGYGDGLVRSLMSGAEMSVCGKRVPVVGKLSMTFAALDITDVPEARPGDTVTVFGYGGGCPTISEYAALYGGHPCEVITMLKEHIPRQYISKPVETAQGF